MNPGGKLEASKKRLSSDKLSSSVPDIDQLCHLIDESTFGLQSFPSAATASSSSRDHQCTSASLASKFRSVPSCQVKIFRSSRLKRLHSSSVKNGDLTDADDQALDLPTPHYRSLYPPSRRTFSMRFSLSSSLLNRFRTLSTYHLPPSRRTASHLTSSFRAQHHRYSSSTITLYRTNSILPSIHEEEQQQQATAASTTASPLACTIMDTRRTAANSCNVEELAAYLDNFLYLPKSLSGAAELMYTWFILG